MNLNNHFFIYYFELNCNIISVYLIFSLRLIFKFIILDTFNPYFKTQEIWLLIKHFKLQLIF